MAKAVTQWQSNRGRSFETQEKAILDDIACDLRDAIDSIDPKKDAKDSVGIEQNDYKTIKMAYVIAEKSSSLAIAMTKLIKSHS